MFCTVVRLGVLQRHQTSKHGNICVISQMSWRSTSIASLIKNLYQVAQRNMLSRYFAPQLENVQQYE